MTESKKLLKSYGLISLAFFLLLSLVLLEQFFYQHSLHKVFRSFSGADLLSWRLLAEISYYSLTFLLLHLFYAFFLWAAYVGSIGRFISKQYHTSLGILWLLAGLQWLMILNQLSSPRSLFTYEKMPAIIADLFCWGYGIALACAIVASFLFLLRKVFTECSTFLMRRVALGLIALFVLIVVISPQETESLPAEKAIILIGVDSLRPTEISAKTTPQIEKFIKQAAFFENTLTPQGRTYSAWMSILTGHYPLHHGARFNLINSNQLNEEMPHLGQILQQAGYQTAYATDERRFSNIDQQQGFEQIIGPSTGAMDFILSYYVDFPLVNILNPWLGNWLFPALYSNRAVPLLYRPQQFVDKIRAFLKRQDKNKPLFLAVHFCLPHWPYFWAEQEKTADNGDVVKLYQQAVAQADKQVGDLLVALQRQGYLRHATVVLLSDHGENLPGETTIYQQTGAAPLEISAFGHGSSVLLPSQNQVVMAWQGYGQQQFVPQVSKQSANLVDIAPTLMALSGKSSYSFDGISLRPWLQDKTVKPVERAFFMETGFYLPAMEKASEDFSKLVAVGSRFYRINKEAKVRLQNNYLPELLRLKERAVQQGQLIYALTPDGQGGYQEIRLDLSRQQLLHRSEAGIPTLFPLLKKQLLQFYQDDFV